MKIAIKKIHLLSLGLFQLITSCILSVRTLENSAGINGGFEISHKGLPVNWLLYATETMWLRIQLNILSAGTCWIDDIHIEKIHL